MAMAAISNAFETVLASASTSTSSNAKSGFKLTVPWPETQIPALGVSNWFWVPEKPVALVCGAIWELVKSLLELISSVVAWVELEAALSSPNIFFGVDFCEKTPAEEAATGAASGPAAAEK